MLFTSFNPKTVEENDFIEVEISNSNQRSFKYNKQELDNLGKEYRRVEDLILTLVNNLKANEINKAKDLIEITTSLSQNDITSYLTAFKSSIPDLHKETKLIG